MFSFLGFEILTQQLNTAKLRFEILCLLICLYKTLRILLNLVLFEHLDFEECDNRCIKYN